MLLRFLPKRERLEPLLHQKGFDLSEQIRAPPRSNVVGDPRPIVRPCRDAFGHLLALVAIEYCTKRDRRSTLSFVVNGNPPLLGGR